MNPCRCGHLGDGARECSKAPRCGEDYLSRISGPLLDRIDMTVQVQPIAPAELSRAPAGEPSAAVARRVAAARHIQHTRGQLNAEADGGAIAMEPEARSFAERAAETLHLSARGFTRVLRVGRTIADLARSDHVRRTDVAEALAFRHRVPGRR